MGLYSRVHAAVQACPSCWYDGKRVFQFKWGDCRLRDYGPGDLLLWKVNTVGEPGHRRVLTIAYAEPCPNCKADDPRLYEISIDNDHVGPLRALPDDATEVSWFGSSGYRVED